MLKRLALVQEAKRAAAEAALLTARAAEEEARAVEEQARQLTLSAHRHWLDHLGKPGFSPEFSRGLSAKLMACDAEEARAAGRTQRATDAHERRQQDWRTHEARVRQGENSLNQLKRRVRRRSEERRLTELADRTTFRWSRP